MKARRMLGTPRCSRPSTVPQPSNWGALSMGPYDADQEPLIQPLEQGLALLGAGITNVI
jgi:hypothetical protein